MPMDEREKEELARKIKEQRRTVWRGEAKSRNQTRTRRNFTTARRISDQEQGRERVRLYLERQQEKESIELSFEQPSDIPRMKRKSRDSQLKIPALKLALLVIIGLIAIILLGVGIGYLVAAQVSI